MTYFEPPTTDSSSRPEPWGVWPTLGITVLILIGFFFTGAVLTLVYILTARAQNPNLADPDAHLRFMRALQKNGNLIAWSSIMSGLAGIGLTGVAIKLRDGWKYLDYLNFQRPTWKSVGIWNALLIVALLIEDKIADFFSKKPDFLQDVVASDQGTPIWLFVAIVVMAPLFEEVLFRGFMFKGMENSWLGIIGTVLVTSFIWAIIHVQYDLFFLSIIFCLGLLFGYARHVTKSIWIPISMHALNNGIAMLSMTGWLHFGLFC